MEGAGTHPEYDCIRIRELAARCIIGINEAERLEKQDVVINIVLYGDLRPAGQSDCIDDAINYKTIKDEVLAMVEGSSWFLLEKLAEEIALICLSHPLVARVRISVDKPGALRFARSVAVEIFR